MPTGDVHRRPRPRGPTAVRWPHCPGITDQRDGEQELSRIKRAMDEAPVGITSPAPHRRTLRSATRTGSFWNDRLHGVEVRGRNCRFLQGEETEAEPVDAMRAAIDADEPVSVELRNYRKTEPCSESRVYRISTRQRRNGRQLRWVPTGLPERANSTPQSVSASRAGVFGRRARGSGRNR